MSRQRERHSLHPTRYITRIGNFIDQVLADDAALKAAAQNGGIHLIANPLNLPSRQISAPIVRVTDAVASQPPSPSSAPRGEVTGHDSPRVAPQEPAQVNSNGNAVIERGRDGREKVVFSVIPNDRWRENPNIGEVKKKLNDLTVSQRSENKLTMRVIPPLAIENNGLVPAYREDPRFLAVVNELLNPDPSLYKGESEYLRKGNAMARLLELLAYDQELLGYNDEDEGRIVLDTERTHQFYLARYPLDSEIRDEFGLVGIDGVTKPDFIIIKDGTIETVVEVTMTKDPEYFRKKYGHFQTDKRSKRHGELYQDATLAFIVSNNMTRAEAQAIVDEFQTSDVMMVILKDVGIKALSRYVNEELRKNKNKALAVRDILATDAKEWKVLKKERQEREQREAKEREEKKAARKNGKNNGLAKAGHQNDSTSIASSGGIRYVGGHLPPITIAEAEVLAHVFQASLPKTQKNNEEPELNQRDRFFMEQQLPIQQYTRAMDRVLQGAATMDDAIFVTSQAAEFGQQAGSNTNNIEATVINRAIPIDTPEGDSPTLAASRTRRPWDGDVKGLLERLDSYPPLKPEAGLQNGRWTTLEVVERSVSHDRWSSQQKS